MTTQEANALAKSHLSRVVHATREGVSCDKMGYADISGWSHATSKPFGSQFKPVRPEVGRQAFTPTRIGSLANVTAFHEARAKLKAIREEIMRPGENTFDPKARDERILKQIIKGGSFFEELYRKLNKACVISKGPEPVIESTESPIAGCRRTDHRVIDRLKTNEIPRE